MQLIVEPARVMLTTLRWAMPLIVGAVAMGGCSKDDDFRDQVRAELKQGLEQLDFRVMLPEYLPEGTRREPIPLLDPPGGITVGFLKRTPGPGDDFEPLEVKIIEEPVPPGTPTPTPPPLPFPVDTPRASITEVDGVEVTVRNDGTAFLGLSAEFNGISILVQLDWTDVSRLSEMQKEALKVMESILDDTG